MKIALINLYAAINYTVNNIIEKIFSEQKHYIEIYTAYSIEETAAVGKIPVHKLKNTFRKSKDFLKICDEIYAYTNESDINAFIVPLDDWKLLYQIKKSYLQLSDKNITFIIPSVVDREYDDFIKLVKYLDRFRNIHIAVAGDNHNLPFEGGHMYNLHFLAETDIIEILQLHINNRRKYIGWRYHLNELRQKIKFHKDLLKHSLLTRFMNPYGEKLNHSEKIPKVIHYCWFGGKPMPLDVQRYVDTWKQAAPDYELKCWSEDNFPFAKYPFAQEALQRKKWAFIADVARLHALYYEGGIYLDTDIELLKPFDEFLQEDGFTSFESLNLIAMAAIGFKKYHPWIAQMLLWYSCIHCDDDYTEIANTKVVSKITKMYYGVKLKGEEMHLPCGVHIYPRDWFSPPLDKDKWGTTENTHCIHHFTGMW